MPDQYPIQSPPLHCSISKRFLRRQASKESEPCCLPRDIRAVKDANDTKRTGRTLIICLDGTGDKFDGDNSNIVHLVSCLKKDDPSQVTYYQSGIGTYSSGGLSNGLAAAVDMAIGSGLGVHIRDAYRFLMQTYREGDKICLFGFSRGAYTARCLAGMIHKVGLLPAHNRAQIPFAYKYYKDDTDWKMSNEFKRTFSIDVSVYFVGVFDSVASVGFIPRKLPLSSTPKNKPLYFRHAMGLDEHRSKFKVCRYQTKEHTNADSEWTSGFGTHGVQSKDVDCLEVWFAGCHADIGGGAVKNEVRHKLSQIPLRWMIRQCFECNTGILFNTHRLAEEGLDVQMLWPVYNKLTKPIVGPSPNTMEKYHSGDMSHISKRSSVLESDRDGHYNVKLWQDDEKQTPAEHWLPEQIEDHFDAMAPINDQLIQARGWWILEVWPIKVRVQPKHSDAWVKKVGVNLGRFRAVQEKDPNIHWTAQQRLDDHSSKMRARVNRSAKWQVVI